VRSKGDEVSQSSTAEGERAGAESTASEPAGRPPPARGVGRVLVVRSAERALLPFAWVLLIAGFGAADPSKFLSVANFSNIFGSQAVLFVLTMALLVPLTNGDIDLSVGALSGLVSMVVATLNVERGFPIAWCAVIGLAVGLVAGAINGLIIVKVNADPFIVTLGTGTVFTGLVYWFSGDQTITGTNATLSQLTFLDEWFGIPIEFYFGLLIMLIIWYLLTFTPYGQRSLFVGQSREVARLSGFNVGRIRFSGFVIAGLITAISGVLFVGTTGSASPGTGDSLLLPAYAAAFLGLTTIQPGRFNALGSTIAVYFLATGVAGLELYGAQDYVQQLFYGAVLVVAVVISRLISRRRYGS
jgi:ribose transport system permease protein